MENVISLIVGSVLGGVVSWMITWFFALRGKKADEARHQELMRTFESTTNEQSKVFVCEHNKMLEVVRKALDPEGAANSTSRNHLLAEAEASHRRVRQAAKRICPVKDCKEELQGFLGVARNNATGIATHYYNCPVHGRVPGGYDELLVD